MPMDGLTLGFIARELQENLQDGRIEKVTQPEKDMLVLLIRALGKNHKLLLSAAPSFARAHLTGASYQNPPDAPMFCMLMRKHLQGGFLCLRGEERIPTATKPPRKDTVLGSWPQPPSSTLNSNLTHIYSTVTDLARFRGLSTSQPRCSAI